MDEAPLLEISNLSTRFFTEDGQVNAVERVSFDVERGEVFGIVGESGSGKSVTALSIMDIVEPPGRITEGEIWYHNRELADRLRDRYPEPVDGDSVNIRRLPSKARRILRGKYFSMIFQNPKDSFNKSYTIGEQIGEAVEVNRRLSADLDHVGGVKYSLADYLRDLVTPREFISSESRERAIELLELVGIPDPVDRADEYPYQFSGGMLQRAMIAQALACDPDLLIADEPTTALDVTIQSQILKTLQDIQQETGMSIVLITHDLGVIARMCDRVAVMYAGEFAETGSLTDIFYDSVHPYTEGLLASAPSVDIGSSRLEPIPGNVPDLYAEEMGDGCYFADRCPKAMEMCREKPPDFRVDDDHTAKCYLAEHPYDPQQAIADGDVRSEPEPAREPVSESS